MTATVRVPALTDAEIKRQLVGSAYRLRCGRHNDLRFQVNTHRTGGSWQRRQGRTWRKLANWPEIGSADAVRILQQLRVREAAGEQASADHFTEVGKLLEWYRDRVTKNRSLSAKRRQGVSSMIDCRLLPSLGGVKIRELTHEVLDEKFVWLQQGQISISYLKACMRVLRMAFTQAHKLRMVADNPLAGMKMTDFTAAKVKPKPAQLAMNDLEPLVKQLAGNFKADPVPCMFALLMLMHGTRIGETRQTQWRHISLQRKQWVIPAEITKTRTELVLPLTDAACALLQAFKDSGRTGERFLFVERVSRKAMGESTALSHFRKLGQGKWTSHDLRKLFRTGLVELNVDFLIGEILLNHHVGLMAETYINTSAENMKLDALERWHALLIECGIANIWEGTDAK